MKLPWLQFIVLVLILVAARCFAQAPDYCQASEVPTYVKWNVPRVFDGPAELPERCVATNPWDMPSPLGSVTVSASGSLQAAYNSAQCGTTIKLVNNGKWYGSYNFTPKNCPDADWITIESAGPLPNPGTQMDAVSGAKLATILLKGSQAINISGDHIRIRGIHIAQVQNTGVSYEFFNLHGANHIVFEQVLCHGNAGQEAQRCIHLSTSQYVAVVDSWLSDFHCIALTGTCGDAQAIGGGVGNPGDPISKAGPYKFVNNHLEGSAETFEFGGGVADGCPSDITVQRNHMFKPLSWNPLDPSYAGVKYTVKNLFELKNACRVLVEGNVLENVWGGFTQAGFAVVFTPKNQAAGGGLNQCPVCTVTDVTFRENVIRSAGGAFLIGNGQNGNGAWPAGGGNYSIHDNVADGLQYPTCYGCGASLIQLSSGYSSTNPPPATEILKNVLFANNTIIAVGDLSAAKQTSQLLDMGGPPVFAPPQMTNISFTNNIVSTLKSGIYSVGGGTNNCMTAAKPQLPSAFWTECTSGTSPFTGNLLVGYTKPQTNWPKANAFAPSFTGLFVNFNGGKGGDYHLAAGSQYVGMGADINAVNASVAGVK